MRKRVLILAALFVSSIFIAAVAPGQNNPEAQERLTIKRKWLDIAYAAVSPAQKLDIYLPDQGPGPFPVIVAIHGGAFRTGDKADGQLSPMLEGLKQGFAVVSLNYRLSGEAVFPAPIQDAKAAIRWLRAHAAEYKLEGAKIAVWGGSAGGYLAALAGVSGGVTEWDDPGLGNLEESSRVQAVVDWFGPVDFLKMDEHFRASRKGRADHGEADSPESRYLGKKLADIPDLVRAANPETYITPDDPPFLIQHGTGRS